YDVRRALVMIALARWWFSPPPSSGDTPPAPFELFRQTRGAGRAGGRSGVDVICRLANQNASAPVAPRNVSEACRWTLNRCRARSASLLSQGIQRVVQVREHVALAQPEARRRRRIGCVARGAWRVACGVWRVARSQQGYVAGVARRAGSDWELGA